MNRTETKSDRGPKVEPEALHGFAKFWAAWPRHFRKTGKRRCAILWARWGLASIADDIIRGVYAWRASRQWNTDGGIYVPCPQNWLIDERWEAAEALEEESLRRECGGRESLN
jgi:hypothetical protein